MRTRALSTLAAGAAAMVLATTFAGPATADDPSIAPSHRGEPTTPAAAEPNTVCFSSLHHPPSLSAVTSQRFERTFGIYRNRAAESFRCSGTGTFDITRVNVLGRYFNGSGPADSVSVRVFETLAGEPDDASVRCSYPALAYTNGPSCSVVLDPPCTVDRGTTYWLGVRANMRYDAGGQWGWDVTTQQSGPAGDWKNVGDGWETGCTAYQNGVDMEVCFPGVGGGPDFMFSVGG